MPALTIFRKFDTSPFAGDDLQILIAILGIFHLLQLACIILLLIHFWWTTLYANHVMINGYAPWCIGYPGFEFSISSTALFLEHKVENIPQRFYGIWGGIAAMYFCVDVAWMCMLWTATSIGTITEPLKRDKYVRRLILVKMFVLSLFPLALLILGIIRVHRGREDHFGCPEGVNFDMDPWHARFYKRTYILLMFTYALELLLWPLVLVNFTVQQLKKTDRYFDRRERLQRRAERLERIFGFVLRMIQCCTCGKFGGHELKNKGELSEFAVNVMHLFNNDTQLNIVLSDMYCGFRMLARVQREKRYSELKLALEEVSSERLDVIDENNGGMCRKRGSIMIVKSQYSDADDCGRVVEREILQEASAPDMNAMKEIAHYVTYASW